MKLLLLLKNNMRKKHFREKHIYWKLVIEKQIFTKEDYEYIEKMKPY